MIFFIDFFKDDANIIMFQTKRQLNMTLYNTHSRVY